MTLNNQVSRQKERPPIMLLVGVFFLTSMGALARGWVDLMAFKLPGNDDYMRLVQLRDWLNGQSWWNVDQSRLGLLEVGDIHFSRIPDVLMAPFILFFSPLVGEVAAEQIMLAAYPLILYGLLLFLLMLTAFEIGGREHGRRYAFAAILVAVATLPIAARFSIGSIDHHSLQLVLTAFSIFAVVKARAKPAWGFAAGGANVTMLAIGFEAGPYLAATALALGIHWILKGEGKALRNYGIAAVGSAALFLIVTTHPSAYLVQACDAYSIVSVMACALMGLGAVSLAMLGPHLQTLRQRLSLSIGTGLLFIVLMASLFPACSLRPFEAFNPLVTELWLSQVVEARHVGNVLATMPAQFAARLMFPCIALGVCFWLLAKGRPEEKQFWIIISIFVSIGILVAFWQLRAAVFANVFGVLPVAALLADLRARVSARSMKSIASFVAGCLFLSPAGYGALAHIEAVPEQKADVSPSDQQQVAAGVTPLGDCLEPVEFRSLNKIEKARLFTQIDIGPEILAFTDHHVSSAPYHRNQMAILATIKAFTSSLDDAKNIIEESGADYLVYCPGAPETGIYASAAPDGLAAQLRAGTIPDWLVPVAGAEGPLRIFVIERI